MEKLEEAKRIWLYAGLWSGWWCYTGEHNDKINNIYYDYCKRNNIACENLDEEQNIVLKKVESQNNIQKILDKSFDCISFEDDEGNESNFKDCQNNFKVVDYIIKTTKDNFKIDFHTMKQINLADPAKQRRIDHIEIPKNIIGNKAKLLIYLKKKSIKGIAGTLFE